ELSGEVDPDDSLLPPSQRCKDQTLKDPTGPLNRRQLLNFLTKFAKEQEDWPENKKFVAGVKLGESTAPLQRRGRFAICRSCQMRQPSQRLLTPSPSGDW